MATTTGGFAPAPVRRGPIADVVSLVRLPSVIAAAIEVLLGSFLATGDAAARVGPLLAVALSMALCVAVAMAFNDVVDRELDGFTKPNRPLPSGRRSIRWASMLVCGAAVGALVCASMCGLAIVVTCAALVAISLLYSLRLKGVPVLGNVTVAACSATPVVVGAMEAAERIPPRAWAAAGLIFLFMFCYEILKTISDYLGDRSGNVSTLSTTVGPRASSLVLLGLTLSLAICVASAGQLSSHVMIYTALGVAFWVSALVAVVPLTRRGAWQHVESVNRSVFVMRGSWMLGLLTLWMLR